MKRWLLCCFSIGFLQGCRTAAGSEVRDLLVYQTVTPPLIDGNPTDSCWANAHIYPMDQLWSGKLPHASDFMGR